MFNATEVEMGPAAREMTCKIQTWNVVSERVHPILVANARVDWLALDDAEVRPLHDKVPNHKGLQCPFYFPAAVLQRSGVTSYSQNVNSGLL